MSNKRVLTLLSYLVTDRTMTHITFRLLSLFLLYTNLDLAVFSEVELANQFNCSISTIKRSLQKLIELNFIERKRYGYGKLNTYLLNRDVILDKFNLNKEYKYGFQPKRV